MANDNIPPTDNIKDPSPVNDASSANAAGTETVERLSQDVTREREERSRADSGYGKDKERQERDKLWDKDPNTGEPKALNVQPPAGQLYADAQQRTNPDLPNGPDMQTAGSRPEQGTGRKAAAGNDQKSDNGPPALTSVLEQALTATEAPAVPDDKVAPAGQQAKDKTKDGADVPLDSATQQAKDKFLEQMRGRLSDADFKELEKKLDQMDQRILHNKVQGRDGQIDQQQELKKTYEALGQLADGRAEGKDGLKYKGENIYNKDDVNKIITDTVAKLADPEHNFNQGQHNTCALQAIARQEAAISPSTFAQRQADIARTGQFQANGQTVKLDVGSLRLDAEARGAGLWAQGGVRGAAGHNNDIAMAQLNLNQKYGTDGNGNGNRVYTQNPNALGHGDTGERVVDRATGQVVGRSPEIDARGVSNTKQAAYGDRFGDNFGRDTTFVNAAAFGNIPNVSSFTNGEDMKNQLKANEAKGWQYSTIGMHTGHWSGSEGQGGAGGWHAVSVSMAPGDKINVINNWGGKFNFTAENGKAQDANTVLGWMNDTKDTSAPGYRPGDREFDPDGQTRPKEKEDPEKKDPEQKQPEEKHEDKKKPETKEGVDLGQVRQLLEALANVAQLQSQLDRLPQGDAQRSELQAAKSRAELDVAGLSGRLTTNVNVDV